MNYLDGERPLTHSGWRGMGYVDTEDGRYIHEHLALGVGECVYGLGERFTAFILDSRRGERPISGCFIIAAINY